MTLTRRQILTGGAAAGVGLAVAGTMPSLGAGHVAAAPASSPSRGRPSDGRAFPPLQDDPNGILAVPQGFAYTIASRAGQTDLSFGQGKTPDLHDGTAVVGADRRSYTLIQNHELGPRTRPRRSSACRTWPGRCTTPARSTLAAARC